VQSWDTASKATELSDFSVCTRCEADILRIKPRLHPGPEIRVNGVVLTGVVLPSFL
jgi:hypothetical protein